MINPMDLTNQIILVTGASSGIGRETSILLSQLGARLVLVGRNKVALDKTFSMLEGKDHVSEVYDLTTGPDNIPHWMKELSNKIGPISGLVHSAGIQITKPIRSISNENINEVMGINVTAAFGLIKGFRQKGVCNSPGSIVIISSVMGLVGQPGVSIYSASKGALIALTKSMALELSRDKIRLNCVAPAHVCTEMAESLRNSLTQEQFNAIEQMHPLGIGTPRDIAYSIAFLLSETGRWITGSTLVVDGGYTAH